MPEITGRYLKRVIATFDDPGNKWHILTTFPVDFAAKCVTFRALIIKHKAILKKAIDNPQWLDELADDVFKAILDDNGIYYPQTMRSKLKVPARTINQTVLYEILSDERIEGADHMHKAKACTLPLLERTAERLDLVANAILPDSAQELQDLAAELVEYFDHHIDCLQQILDFDPKTELPAEDAELSFQPSGIVQQWHAVSVKELTPIRATPSVKKVREEHAVYSEEMRSRKSARFTPQFDAHGSPIRPTAALTTTSTSAAADDDCGFDFSGWSSPGAVAAAAASPVGLKTPVTPGAESSATFKTPVTAMADELSALSTSADKVPKPKGRNLFADFS